MTYIDLSTLPFRERAVSELPDTVLALGNFDGVHVGHSALLHETVRQASALNTESTPVLPGVWLFRTPPSDFLRKPPIPHLSTLHEKLSLFREYGIQVAIIEDFEAIASASPEEFAIDVLQKKCRCKHAVCGFNYSFGHRGSGTSAHLRTLLGGAVSEIPSVEIDGLPVSSTRIRTLLTEGDVQKAAELLGRPYSINLPVLHGKALGRTIDFPTLNQNFTPFSVIPKPGIYAVTVRLPDEDVTRYGIANIGTRPTVENTDAVNCETYVLDFSGDLYGKTVTVGFVERLRDERKMSGIDELRATIRNDEHKARRIFGLPER